MTTSQRTPVSHAAESDRRRALVAQLTHVAALQGERLVCICRFVFCALVLIRFWLLDLHLPLVAKGLKVSTTLAAMGYSLWMWRTIRVGKCSAQSLRTSVITDAVICFLCLLGTTLWPGFPNYSGLLTRPEPACVLIMIFTSGFRLSPRLASLGGGLNGAGVALLLAVDRWAMGPKLQYGPAEIFFFCLAVVSAAVLAFATASITGRLVESVSLEVLRVQGVRHQLTDIIRDQHDAKSLLSTAALNADLVCRSLESGERVGARHAVSLVRDLRDALQSLSGAVRRLSDRTVDQLTVLREPSWVDVGAVVERALPALRVHFPSLEIFEKLRPTPRVRVLGGRGGLERALFNLLLNAQQGDGQRRARRVWIGVDVTPQGLRLSVDDDGPGFADDVRIGELPISRKASGNGFGLYGVMQLAEASGGRLLLGPSAHGGAAVVMMFPAAAPAFSLQATTTN